MDSMNIHLNMKQLPLNANDETRRKMYNEYIDLYVAMNSSWFLPIGVRKRWWHFFKIEHPRTKKQ